MNKKRKINGIIIVCLILTICSIGGVVWLSMKDNNQQKVLKVTHTVRQVGIKKVAITLLKTYVGASWIGSRTSVEHGGEDPMWGKSWLETIEGGHFYKIKTLLQGLKSCIYTEYSKDPEKNVGERYTLHFNTWGSIKLGQTYLVSIDTKGEYNRDYSIKVTETQDTTEILTCKPFQTNYSIKVPKLNISFEKEVGKLELPFYTRYGDKIVTLKGGLTLKFNQETRRLELWMKSKAVQPVNKIPLGNGKFATRLGRMNIYDPAKTGGLPLSDVVKVFAPDNITLIEGGSNKPPEKE